MANSGNNNVSVIDIAANNISATVNVGRWPNGVAVTPDGKKVYVTNQGSNTVSVIDTATNTVTATIPVGYYPRAFGQVIGSVPQPELPVSNLSSNVISGHVPLTVQFTNSYQNATELNWNFGDGTYTTGQNPLHTYLAVGNYTVTLTTRNEAGTYTETKIAYIKVKPDTYTDIGTDVELISSKPVASFCAHPTSENTPLKVKFTDRSAGSPTSWKWSFGDRTYSTEKNPVHAYKKAGNYAVTLTVKNAEGCSNQTICESIPLCKRE